MRTVITYLKQYKREVVLAPLFKLLEASFELIVPLVVAQMIDRGVGGRDTGYIWRGFILLLSFGIIGFVCAVVAQYFAAKAAVFATAKVRSDMMARISSLSFEALDASSDSTFLTRMTSDVNQVQTTINMVLRLFLRSPFIVFGAVAMAFYVDWRTARVFVATVLLLSITIYAILRLTMPMYRRIQKQLDRLTLIVRENLAGVRVIRAFNGQEAQIALFQEDNRKLADFQNSVGKISGLMNPLTMILINGGIVGVLYAGGFRVTIGDLTGGELVALVNYMSQILVELLKLAAFIISVSKGIACAGRLEEILNLEPEIRADEEVDTAVTSPQDVAARMDHVTFTYHGGGACALSDITFHVKSGETVGLLGGTGSGKSTILQVLCGFYELDGGTVELFGEKMKPSVRSRLLERVGIVPQKAVLFSGTLADNLRWGRADATQEQMYEALCTAQAEAFIREKDGLSTHVEEGGRNFSGGQRQRLTIARALVRRADLLLLDDSFSALDYATDAALRRALAQRDGNAAIIIASQRVSTLMNADRVYVLDEGEIVGSGTHDQLMASCDVYREIYDSQTGHGEGKAMYEK